MLSVGGMEDRGKKNSKQYYDFCVNAVDSGFAFTYSDILEFTERYA